MTRVRNGRLVQGAGRATYVVLLVLCCGTGLRALAQELPAQPRDYVVDLAGVVDQSTFAQLNSYLQRLEKETGAQLIVLTVQSTGTTPIRDYGLHAAEQWHLGKKGRDDGALLLIAVQDRKWDVETGYGLEPVLTDQFCGEAAREYLAPHAQRGEYSRGLHDLALALANRIAAAKGVQVAGMPVVRTQRVAQSGRVQPGGACALIACWPIGFIVLFFIIMGLARRATYGRRRRGYGGTWGGGGIWPWLFVASELSRSGRRGGHWGGGFGGSGGFGGGGFGGFGGGSFGGGGGGSFGGGGASGGW